MMSAKAFLLFFFLSLMIRSVIRKWHVDVTHGLRRWEVYLRVLWSEGSAVARIGSIKRKESKQSESSNVFIAGS